MSNYLIDTHIFLYLVFAPEKISKKQLTVMQNPKNRVYISNITFWEISLKFSLKKLELNGVKPQDLVQVAKDMDLEILNIDEDMMAKYHELPRLEKHKDPFDRLLIHTCIQNSFIFISNDSKVRDYKKYGLKFL